MSLPLPERGTVRALLLDAGGVLVRPNFERVAEVLRRHGVPAEPAGLAAADGQATDELDRPPGPGSATDEERGFRHFQRVFELSGITPSAATEAALADLKRWHDAENLWEDVLPGVRESLARFRQGGLRLAVVSNANGTVRRLLERLGLLDVFRAVLDSRVEGIEKPDPRLFRLALERLAVRPEEALHVGDLYYVDVVGARAAGLRAVLLDARGGRGEVDCPRVASLSELADHLVPEGAGPILLNSEAAR